MKHWRIITAGTLAAISLFVPFAVFATISQYENPLCGHISSLPDFIKGILTIIVKVGVPVATIFIIWSGFLFLTAQGNEAQLTKAKHSFVWACIGTAVLLGSWALSVAIKGTIDDISGGEGKVASGGVGGGPCGGGSGASTPKDAASSVAGAFCSTEEAKRELMEGSATMDGDTMDRYKLESSDPNLLSKSFAITQNIARTEATEQSFVFVQYKGGGGVFAHTNNSSSMAGTPVIPISTIQKGIIDTSIVPIESIHIIHTHPSATLRGNTDAPPSLDDLVQSYEYSRRLGVPIITEAADPNGVWRYSVPSSSAVGKQIELSDQVAKLPEVQDFAKSLGDADTCSPDSLKKFADLRYSPSSFAVASDLSSVDSLIQPLRTQDAGFSEVFNNPTADDSDTRRIAEILRQRLETEKDIGIDVRRVFP